MGQMLKLLLIVRLVAIIADVCFGQSMTVMVMTFMEQMASA
jgi:hypothetical protein